MKAVGLVAIVVFAVTVSCTSSTAANQGSPQIVIAGELPIERNGGVGANDASRAVAIAIANHPMVGRYRLAYEDLSDSLAGFPNVDKAVQNAQVMVGETRIVGIVGPWNSLISRYVIPITAQANLVMLSPSSTLDCLTARPQPCLTAPSSGSNFFRIAAPDPVAVRAEADIAIRNLGLTKFAVITDGEHIYGEPVGDAFAAEVAADGGTVTYRQMYSQTDQSYAPLLRDAIRTGAEAVFVGGFTSNGACRIRSEMVRVFPVKSYFFSGDGIVDSDCARDAEAGADDHLIAAVSARLPVTVQPQLRSLRNTGYVDAYVLAAYDCAEILIAGIERAIKESGGKIPTREEVLAAVAATHEFKGLTGTFTFNAAGDAASPAASLYYVRNATWTWWRNA